MTGWKTCCGHGRTGRTVAYSPVYLRYGRSSVITIAKCEETVTDKKPWLLYRWLHTHRVKNVPVHRVQGCTPSNGIVHKVQWMYTEYKGGVMICTCMTLSHLNHIYMQSHYPLNKFMQNLIIPIGLKTMYSTTTPPHQPWSPLTRRLPISTQELTRLHKRHMDHLFFILIRSETGFN